MNYLNNIARDGGFPVSAEVLTILAEHGDYISALLDTMPRAIVFLQKNVEGGVIQDSIIYYRGIQAKKGKIYKLKGTGITESELIGKAGTLIITEVKKDVVSQKEDNTITTYPDCYRVPEATLSLINEGYPIYSLYNLFESAGYIDKAEALAQAVNNAGVTGSGTLSLSLNQNRRKFNDGYSKLVMQFAISVTRATAGDITQIQLPVEINSKSATAPISAVMLDINYQNPVQLTAYYDNVDGIVISGLSGKVITNNIIFVSGQIYW